MNQTLTQVDRPSNDMVIDRGMLPTADVVARVRRIQEVMQALMKEGTHFGTIPGTPKPTLYKPGAELILTTFRIAATPSNIEDLSTEDEIRYRVTVRGSSQVGGELLGEMSGECSSNEEKYRWRKPVCDEEWEETPEDRRRAKWAKGRDGKGYKQKQVRTSPADVANTVLKMAIKRALIAMTLVTTGCSDIFAQDLEDLSEEIRDSVVEETKAPIQQPQRKSEAAKPVPTVTLDGLLLSVTQPADKKFWIFKVDGDSRYITTFSETLANEGHAFVATKAPARLTIAEKKVEDKTFYNVTKLEAVPDTPAATPPAAVPITSDEIFGGREPGGEG